MEQISYQLVRSGRKTIGLEIRDGKLIVRAPYRVPQYEINALINRKRAWIVSHLEASRRREEERTSVPPLTREELEELARQALEYIPPKAKEYARQMGVTFRRITIRNQRTRWGSCSAKGNLNFNCLLMLASREAVDCVIVHELAHLKEMNHSDRFYREVLRVYPDYYKWHGWLKEHQAEIMDRMG